MSLDCLLVDTSYWFALTWKHDACRPRALSWSDYLQKRNSRLIVTEPVLWETVNGLSQLEMRATAMSIWNGCVREKGIEFVPTGKERVERALGLYSKRKDKEWSLTDCFSFVVMKEFDLTAALMADRHYLQAGFRALLLEEVPA